MFFRGSRYADVPVHEITDSSGRVIRYKGIREIPDTRAERAHVVRQGERIDIIAHEAFQDSERFWRICDVNQALWPNDLLIETGRRLLIPSSEG